MLAADGHTKRRKDKALCPAEEEREIGWRAAREKRAIKKASTIQY
jgi:hypothetical protein